MYPPFIVIIIINQSYFLLIRID